MYKNKQNGFTILEIIVVISLMSILGIIGIVNYRGASKKKALDVAAEKLASDLKELQSNALSSKSHNGSAPCGWGLYYVDASSYAYYVGGKPGGQECDDAGVNRDYQAGQDTIVKTVDIINNGEVEFAGSFNDIFFEPPNPDTYIGNVKTGITMNIVLQLISDPLQQKTITITSSGKIEVN